MSENRDAWFERELRKQQPEKGVDFSSVESVLLRRIRECEELGPLSLLRLDEQLPAEKAEMVERDLFSQITQYNEYDAPIDECLKREADLSENEWKRLKSRLYERLQPVVKLPAWEQQLMAPCNEPTTGHWEALETVLFDRINRCNEQMRESWVCIETREEPATPSTLETAETLLDEKIVTAEAKPFWEQVLSSEEIVPYAVWERMEERLFALISRKKKLEIGQQPFWFIRDYYRSLLQGIGISVGVAACIVLGIVGFRFLEQADLAAPTVVYQLGGNAAGSYDMAETLSGHCSAVEGGSVTLVNDHGSIELFNSAAVSFEKISKHHAHYRIEFSVSEGSSSNAGAAFFVRPRKNGRSFTVITPDYRISVAGTYFRVEEDLAGRTATRVLEGSVRITGIPIGDTVLNAGEYLQFDPSVQKYRIFGGGQVVPRSELEQLPAVEDLLRYKVLSLWSSVAGADVFIDGRYYGTTPLTVRLPATRHQVRIEKEGYRTIDTLFSLSGGGTVIRIDFALSVRRADAVAALPVIREGKKGLAAGRRSRTGKTRPGQEESAYKRFGAGAPEQAAAKHYNEARIAERNGEWQKALRLYRQVLAEPALSPLRSEDAMFSIAKIQAEHGNDDETAKESFLKYLALFPSGSFAGESWLRLAELEFRQNQEQAIHYYLKFFEKFPRHPRIAELQDRVGVIYMQQKRFDKAVGMFELALSNLSPLNGDDQRNIAAHLYRALLDQGEAHRAEAVRAQYLVSEQR